MDSLNQERTTWLDKMNKSSNIALVLLTIFNILIFWDPFAKEKFFVQCDKNLFIEQNWGILNFEQFIDVKNVGDKTGFITKIEGLIRSKDRNDNSTYFRKKISAELYQPMMQDALNPLLEISLLPNSSFSSNIYFFKNPDRFTSDSISILQSMVIDEADVNDIENAKGNIDYIVKHANKNTASLISNFINNRIQEFKAGEYEYIVEFTKNNEKSPFCTKCYSFVIYEPSIFQLQETEKNNFEIERTPWQSYQRPILRAQLTEIENPDIVESLKVELNNSK
jgi:hypothetical protein